MESLRRLRSMDFPLETLWSDLDCFFLDYRRLHLVPLSWLLSSRFNDSWIRTENPRSSTTLCSPRPASTTITATTSSWEQLAVATSACAPCRSPTPATPTSSAPCQRPRPATKKLVMHFELWNKVLWITKKNVFVSIYCCEILNSITAELEMH